MIIVHSNNQKHYHYNNNHWAGLGWAGPSVPGQHNPRRQTVGWLWRCAVAAANDFVEEEEASANVMLEVLLVILPVNSTD